MSFVLKINDKTLWTVENPVGNIIDYSVDGISIFKISASGAVTIADGAAIFKVLTTTATLDFPNTAKGESSDLTISLTGATLGDVVCLGVPNGSVIIDTSYSAFVSATNIITVRFNNYTSKVSNNPPSGAFRVLIFKV